jgi:hypothetical protein
VTIDDEPDQQITMAVPVSLQGSQQLGHLGFG